MLENTVLTVDSDGSGASAVGALGKQREQRHSGSMAYDHVEQRYSGLPRNRDSLHQRAFRDPGFPDWTRHLAGGVNASGGIELSRGS